MFAEALSSTYQGVACPIDAPMPDFAAKTKTDPTVSEPAEERSALPLPSFRALYEEQFDFVWRFAAHRGVPHAALEDVVQEVFLVVASELSRFEGRSALRTWIAGITRNVVHSYRRKRGNQAKRDSRANTQCSVRSGREMPTKDF